ncbi:hypothetical protein Tco_0716328 [Tanacetum coccineum]
MLTCENTRDPTPPINTVQDEEHVEQGDTQEHLVFSDVHDKDNDEDTDQHRFMPEILSSLTNCEVVRRTYQSLGWSIRSPAELLKRHEQLNRDHVELYNRSEVQMGELSRLGDDYQREM